MLHRRALLVPLLGLPLVSVSCGVFAPKDPPRATRVLHEWHDDGGPGKVTVEINLTRQLATYRRGGRFIGWSYVSTGKEGHSTPAGNYTITERMPLKHSDRYGWISDASGKVTNGDATPKTPVPPGEHYSPSPMNWWMRITRYGIGLHAGDIPNPGEPESHGCIRLPRDFVEKLYQATEIGTPVRITR